MLTRVVTLALTGANLCLLSHLIRLTVEQEEATARLRKRVARLETGPLTGTVQFSYQARGSQRA